MSVTQWGLALVAGALTTLNPCVFPILPLVVGSALQSHRAAPLLMGLGMALAFALLGLATAVLAGSTSFDADTLRFASASLMVLFGIVLMIPQAKAVFARLITPLANAASQLESRLGDGDGNAPASPWRSLLMGMLLGAVWTPCSGPLLASTLSIAAQGSVTSATLTLAIFGLGAAIPLIGVGYLSRAALNRLRQWVLTHGSRAQQVLGAVLALVGLAVLLGLDKALEAQLNHLLPSGWLSWTTRW